MSNVASASPFWGVEVDISGVGVEVRVNDIPIYIEEDNGHSKVEVPFPEYVIDGENAFSVRAFPPIYGDSRLEEYSGEASVSLWFYQQATLHSRKTDLWKVKLIVGQDGKLELDRSLIGDSRKNVDVILSSDEETIVSAKTQIKSPYPMWKWQTGKTIEVSRENYSSLLDKYKEIHSYMKLKNLLALEKEYDQRAEEIAIAYGLENKSAGHKKISTGEDALDPRLALYDMHVDGVGLDVIANGRLARLVDADSIQPIFYYQEDRGLLHLHKMLFYMDQSGNWVMIR